MARPDLTDEQALYNAFVRGANATKSTDRSIDLHPQNKRTTFLSDYLFETGGFLSEEDPLLKTEGKSKQKTTFNIGKSAKRIAGHVVVYGIGLYVITNFGENKKSATEKTQDKAPVADTTQIAKPKKPVTEKFPLLKKLIP